MLSRILPLAALAALLGGCATLPDVLYSYYPAKTNVSVTLTQTLSCTDAKDPVKPQFIVVNTAALTSVSAADLTAEPMTFRIKAPDASYADTDFSATFYDDGRLKGVNQSATGQGENILKSAISTGAAIAGFGGAAPDSQPPDLTDACNVINKWAGGKPITLVYSSPIDFAKQLPVAPLPGKAPDASIKEDSAREPEGCKCMHYYREVVMGIDPGYSGLYKAITSLIPQDAAGLPEAKILIHEPLANRSGARALRNNTISDTGCDVDVSCLTLQQTSTVEIGVQVDGAAIFDSTVSVPLGGTYSLPIPNATLFGTQKFSLALSESGAITSIDYSKSTGAASVFNVGNAIATNAAPESTASKAADLKAQGDLIANQQRLNLCEKDATQCK